MFQSFTGNSRRPRQVNLSGRNPNPFAVISSGRSSPATPVAQKTLVVAQQERLARQQERDRLHATRRLQRTWRGYSSRRGTHQKWRKEWDTLEATRLGCQLDFQSMGSTTHDLPQPNNYVSETDCWMQLKLLLQFMSLRDRSDIMRLEYFSSSLRHTLKNHESISDAWAAPLRRLGDMVLKVLAVRREMLLPIWLVSHFIVLLIFISRAIPGLMGQDSDRFYKIMADVTIDPTMSRSDLISRPMLIECLLALLEPLHDQKVSAYREFAIQYLTTPEILVGLGDAENLAARLNYKVLFKAIIPTLRNPSGRDLPILADGERRLWLLASLIFFHSHAHGSHDTRYMSEPDFIEVVSLLLGSIADDVALRIDLDTNVKTNESDDSNRRLLLQPLPVFVRQQLLSLLDQTRIKSFLTGISLASNSSPISSASHNVKVLASYALTLLRVFRNQGNDIRLWLFLGSTSTSGNTAAFGVSAVRYFWDATQSSNVFQLTLKDHSLVLDLLSSRNNSSKVIQDKESIAQEWRVMLIFLELYTYVLQVMDDEEFFSAEQSSSSLGPDPNNMLRQSALPLRDAQKLTLFLKYLAFSLYWNRSLILGSDDLQDEDSIRKYFSATHTTLPTPPDCAAKNRSGGDEVFTQFVGVSFDYLKGLVTGVLRMIYERDSRRKFMPNNHWLMTGRFDMAGFIPAVVAEYQARESRKRELGDTSEAVEDELDDDTGDEDFESFMPSVRTSRTRRVHVIERLAKRQRQQARKRYLQAVAPRLEILENMPFFIPFETRVEIFRRFIYDDQMTRRKGVIDPDHWRMQMVANSIQAHSDLQGHEALQKHHANIHRESVFDDAYDQFYSLGEELKEPIYITFVDKFDTAEAGIDGGGVTKEFLESVTSEAFHPTDGLNLFLENDQHLLYPNPTSVEQRKDLLREAGFMEGSPEWNHHIAELLRRYEFLGRVVGKCLYEGILIDVKFVGFFLLKWALTGGATFASKETQYRASFNDLRDLDEGLYQGLLQLKNYPGDVEDFALNFTVTDTIPLLGPTGQSGANGTSRTISRELKPNGTNIPVTNQNRLPYIQYVARHRLQNQPALQTNAFLKGLQQMITPSWLSMFNQAELQTLLSGAQAEIDIADLRRNTQYGGVYAIGDDGQEHPTVQLFWQVMERISDADRRKVLKFVTSTPRAPLLGFSHLKPRFSIRDSTTDEDRLPSTSTCVNLLKLPRYQNEQTLREKLLYAVNSGAGFDLS